MNKVHSYIEFDSDKRLEQNNIVILNVYTWKYIELVVYMFQDHIPNITFHITPDLNQFMIRILKTISCRSLKTGKIPRQKREELDKKASLSLVIGQNLIEEQAILNNCIAVA